MGSSRAHLDRPFFSAAHRSVASRADDWARGALGEWVHGPDVNAVCRRLAGELGAAGSLAYAVRDGAAPDVRSLCLTREVLAYSGGLPDFAFAMQGLGTRAIARDLLQGMAA